MNGHEKKVGGNRNALKPYKAVIGWQVVPNK